MKVVSSPHLVLRLRMGGSMPLLRPVPSWLVEGQLELYFRIIDAAVIRVYCEMLLLAPRYAEVWKMEVLLHAF
jgi:hypothetical protein